MEIVVIIILLVVFYILYKKGILRIRSQSYLLYKAKYTPNWLRASYKKFNGYEYYHFWLKKGYKITVSYNVTVESGSLILEWRDSKRNCYFWKEFHTSESGAFSFEATRRLNSIKLEGKKTTGNCTIELEKEAQ